ncbi:MAG TPA: PhzF family phenazine biosynthesis protein [Planctomycetota bacterium]|nr:PhzF family phenazine biosynthesis protein [Planctomycetota bacterium]
MTVPILQVDAFADRPFRGNPAAVCLLERPAEAAWMQEVASEMNLSETAFVVPRADGFDLRWFTPACEVDLCGHATLAAAHALYDTGRLAPDGPARFRTASGLLVVSRQANGSMEMDFPAEPARAAAVPRGLLEALGAGASFVGRNRIDYLVELADAATVRRLAPDMARLKLVDIRGVIVTARSDEPAYDFVSRFFGPQVGIDEDPVTGSAHCCLGPYWGAKLGKSQMVGYQASRRGGVVGVRISGDRVLLSGRAVTVLRGELVA